jgi:hypothetical protein
MTVDARSDRSAWTEAIVRRHGLVVLVMSPPRASSTAFSRALWASREIAYYAHEPYEASYFGNSAGMDPEDTLDSPLALAPLTGPKEGNGMLVKEISFQAANRFPDLLELATVPPVFIIRDPRLTVASRREVRRAQGVEVDFPVAQTGWIALGKQIDWCRQHGRDYCIIDATDFRARPEVIFPRVCKRLGIDFSPDYLSWEPQPNLCLSNHRSQGPDHFFTRVLASSRIEPPVERVPEFHEFPLGELREHLRMADGLYRDLRRDQRLISA